MRIDFFPFMLHRSQPNELQIDIVVRHGRRNILHKKIDVIDAAEALERRAQRTADIFS